LGGAIYQSENLLTEDKTSQPQTAPDRMIDCSPAGYTNQYPPFNCSIKRRARIISIEDVEAVEKLIIAKWYQLFHRT